MSDLDEMDRESKVALYALNVLFELNRTGFVEGSLFGEIKLTEKARADFEHMKEEGFEPGREELVRFVHLLCGVEPGEIRKALNDCDEREDSEDR